MLYEKHLLAIQIKKPCPIPLSQRKILESIDQVKHLLDKTELTFQETIKLDIVRNLFCQRKTFSKESLMLYKRGLNKNTNTTESFRHNGVPIPSKRILILL